MHRRNFFQWLCGLVGWSVGNSAVNQTPAHAIPEDIDRCWYARHPMDENKSWVIRHVEVSVVVSPDETPAETESRVTHAMMWKYRGFSDFGLMGGEEPR